MFYGISKYDNKTEWEKNMNENIGEEHSLEWWKKRCEIAHFLNVEKITL